MISVGANGDQIVFVCFLVALLSYGLYLILCDMWPSLFTANERDMWLQIELWYLNFQAGSLNVQTVPRFTVAPCSPAAFHFYICTYWEGRLWKSLMQHCRSVKWWLFC